MFQNFTIELPNIKIKQINYEISYSEYLKMKKKIEFIEFQQKKREKEMDLIHFKQFKWKIIL